MAHSVMHFEVVGKDLDKLQKFYGELFGWKTKKIPGDIPYAMVEKEDGGIGAAASVRRRTGTVTSRSTSAPTIRRQRSTRPSSSAARRSCR